MSRHGLTEVGDFLNDGERIVTEVTEAGGIKTRPTNPIEKVQYQMDRNGYKTVQPQDSGHWENTGDPDNPFIDGTVSSFHTEYGLTWYVPPANIRLKGLSVFRTAFWDLLPNQALGGILHIPQQDLNENGEQPLGVVSPATINSLSFTMSKKTYSDDGDEVPDGWNHIVISSAVSTLEQNAFVFKLQEFDEIIFKKEFSPKDAQKARYIIDRPYLRVRQAASYLVRIRCWKIPVADGADQEDYGVEIWFYTGSALHQVDVQVRPNASTTMPAFVPTGTSSGFDVTGDWRLDEAITSVSYISQVVIGRSDPIDVGLSEVATEVSNSDLPITARGVKVAIDANQAAIDGLNKAVTAFNSLKELEGIPNETIIRPEKATIFFGYVFYNDTKASIKLPNSTKDTVLADMKAAGFIQRTSVVTKDENGVDILLSLVDLEGKTVEAHQTGFELAYWRDADDKIQVYSQKAGVWTKGKPTSNIVPLKQKTAATPYWPANVGPANNNGSIMVRKGETTTVNTTLALNNGFAGSNQLVQTFSAAERGKTYIVRAAIPDANKTGRIDIAARTTAQGVVGDYSLAYSNGAWVASGGTVTVDNGYAVLEVSITFAANMDTLLYRWISPGTIQELTLYEAGKAAFTESVIGVELTANDGTTKRTISDVDRASVQSRLTAIEGRVDATAPIFAVGGVTRADDVAFINIPDRPGVRFSSLEFIAGDGRKVSNGFEYIGRQQKFVVPASWLDMGAVAGRTGWTPETFASRNSLKTRIDYTAQAGSTTIYDIWLQWRRNATSWDIWFQGQHTTTNAKPVNQFCGAYDITAKYVIDTNAVDPGLAPLQARVTAIETDYAKKANLLKRSPRTKTWAATLAGLTVTGGTLNDNSAQNQIPLEADLDAPVFAAIVNPGPATVRFTATGLVIGEKYEFIMKEGIGLAKAVVLPANFIQTNTPDWRVYKLVFTADKTTMDGFFSLTGSANIQGPAIYRVPGVFGHDKDLNEIRLAELSDIPASQTVDLTPYAKLTDIPAAPKRINPAWFPAERDFGKTYTRNTASNTKAVSISFEWHPWPDGNVPVMTANYLTANWSQSAFWGAPALFINTTPPNGVPMTIAVVAHDSGKVEIGVGKTAGASSASIGRVRNVMIDGIPADVL